MCKRDSETVDHLFLLCPVASSLWANLFQVAGLTWGSFASCSAVLEAILNFFGGKRKGSVLDNCAMMAVFWVIWGEKNRRFF